MTTWTPKTQQSETWTGAAPIVLGVGYSQGFAPRPAFARGFRNGIWAARTQQSETWTPVS